MKTAKLFCIAVVAAHGLSGRPLAGETDCKKRVRHKRNAKNRNHSR